MSAGISAVSSLFSVAIEMGTHIVFFEIVATVTEYMSREGDSDVDAVLLFKNPLLRLH
jgi:hypothetical protein